ncbi:MAG TPA: serine/threonine-protein kinase [Lentisphaeria bacterium]|nr:serine/threonine-protein kinase [Lentisphaeria bacterium]
MPSRFTYSVLGHFATGGMADLYSIILNDGQRALLRELQAAKVFRISLHRRFRFGLKVREILSPHDHIANSLEWGYSKLRPYELIEWVEGQNLKSLFNARSTALTDQVMDILFHAATALAWVHEHDLMHLDVKPENFLCRNDKNDAITIKLTDFDLSRPADDNAPKKQLGTPAYMAPEQFKKKTASMASDVFAFSVMAYQLLTGKMPFTGDTPKKTWRNQASDSVLPRPPIELIPELPEKVNRIIMRGLVKRPQQRLPDMRAWLHEWKYSN